MVNLEEIFDRLERFYDAAPRDCARVEEFGGLVLFVRTGAGWPYYARPRLRSNRGTAAVPAPTVADITAVRARQRELGVPESFEWVDETTPELQTIARAAGLSILLAPLLVLDPCALPDPGSLGDLPVRLADPGQPSYILDIASQRAVAQVGFAADSTRPGRAGPAERDAALLELAVDEVAEARRRALAGRVVTAVADSPTDGVLASGVLQRVDNVAEIAGIATLPCARRRGLGAAVTATLAQHAVDTGAELVFLSAGSDEVARLYGRLGFRRIGTACIAEPRRP